MLSFVWLFLDLLIEQTCNGFHKRSTNLQAKMNEARFRQQDKKILEVPFNCLFVLSHSPGHALFRQHGPQKRCLYPVVHQATKSVDSLTDEVCVFSSTGFMHVSLLMPCKKMLANVSFCILFCPAQPFHISPLFVAVSCPAN